MGFVHVYAGIYGAGGTGGVASADIRSPDYTLRGASTKRVLLRGTQTERHQLSGAATKRIKLDGTE